MMGPSLLELLGSVLNIGTRKPNCSSQFDWAHGRVGEVKSLSAISCRRRTPSAACRLETVVERKPLYAVTGPRLIVEMTWPEVDALLRQTKTLVLSVGSVEQHGPHLPLWSDYYQGDEQIRRT